MPLPWNFSLSFANSWRKKIRVEDLSFQILGFEHEQSKASKTLGIETMPLIIDLAELIIH